MNKFEKISLKQWKEDTGLTEEDLKELTVPTRKTAKSCGYDFHMPYTTTIKGKETKIIFSGIKVQLDSDKRLSIYPRSSVGIKKGLMLTNTVALIDADYYNNKDNEGHILIALTNTRDTSVVLNKGDRFVQGVIDKFYTVDSDNATGVRTSGIGSTGK